MTVERWTPEQKNEIRKLWCDDRQMLSARQIGERYGVSRCSILGLLHRMGLDGNRGASPEVVAARQAQRRNYDQAQRKARYEAQRQSSAPPKSAKVVVAFKPAEALPAVEMLNIPFIQRRPDQCSMISGDPGPAATCCGLPVVEGTAWCPRHRAMVYEPRAARAAQTKRPNRTTTRYGALRVA